MALHLSRVDVWGAEQVREALPGGRRVPWGGPPARHVSGTPRERRHQRWHELPCSRGDSQGLQPRGYSSQRLPLLLCAFFLLLCCLAALRISSPSPSSAEHSRRHPVTVHGDLHASAQQGDGK